MTKLEARAEKQEPSSILGYSASGTQAGGKLCFVSGHEFNRAVNVSKNVGFSPWGTSLSARLDFFQSLYSGCRFSIACISVFC